MLYFARFLIGAGSAAAFITPLKVVGDHIQEGKKGLFMGLTLACGTIGPLIAGKPLSLMIEEFGWRDAGLYSSIGGVILFACIFFIVPSRSIIDQMTRKIESSNEIAINIKKILKNKTLFIYAIIAFAFYTPLAVLSDTWGTTFLMEKYQITRDAAAECTSFIFIGLCTGCFIIPAYFERKNLLNQGIQIALIIMCLIFLIILTQDLSINMIKVFLFFFGFSAGAEMLCFTGVSNSAPDGIRGLGLGFANTVNMVGGAILQQVVGFLLEYFWSGKLNEKGLHHYAKEDFEKTFMFYIIIYVISLILARIYLKNNKS
jgi:predicted MFS family arabinose efflux permease